MSPFNPVTFLSGLREPNKRLCFYPSAGSHALWAVMALDADVFVFADYWPQHFEARMQFCRQIVADFQRHNQPIELVNATIRTRLFKSGPKWGCFFFQDNNEVLAKIVKAGWKVAIFVGIRDGCCGRRDRTFRSYEGGNYECVNEAPFMPKLLAAASYPLTYITNHSRLLVGERKFPEHHHEFKRRVVFKSRWEFVRRNVLDDLRRLPERRWSESHASRDHEPIAPARSGRPSSRIDDQEIFKLAPFCIEHNERFIAQYVVSTFGS